ncbi:FxSxx-COOH system tetratricopeptide repeat protein, partial [Methanoculleus sp.]|uniref:FxSxx-COOH system tetratricopeptide repeat protein n=1 Tax=Methanoculleus sp. TaxID=90427 RepID=UPI001BD65B5D
MADFFISYNKADESWAEWVAWALEENNYSVIIQAWDFRPGNTFVVCMDNALKEANVLISILSPYYLESKYCRAEWTSTFCGDPTGERREIIPVRVCKTAVDGLLQSRIYIDLVDLDEKQAKKRLLQGVSQERAKPSQPPCFPGTEAKLKRPRFPGALPGIWNVPFLQNNNFTGRVNVFQAIETSLDSQTRSSRIHALHGLSGTGKTQVLVEYAYRFAAKYDLVWWIRSESPETLLLDYFGLAEQLGLNTFDVEEPERKKNVIRSWLETNDNWLLIFDNAKRPEHITNFIPRSPTGDVLVSSTYPYWRGLCSDTSITEFSPDESLDFIYKRTNQDCNAASETLAESLGHLPLALAQACAYIETKGLRVSEYNSRYQRYHTKLLERNIPRDYPFSLVKTLEMSYQEVEEQSKDASDLLLLCCFFGPSDIPLRMLTESSERMHESLKSVLNDELLLDEAIETLLCYSLIECKEGYISIHQLVQEVIRDRLDEDARRQWAEAAVQILNTAFPRRYNNPQNWQESFLLLPHALSAAGHAEDLNVALMELGPLLSCAGFYLQARAEFNESREAYERALRIDEKTYGPDHPNVAQDVNNIGTVLRDLGDLSGAKEYFERALRISEEACRPKDYPNIAVSVNNIGAVLHALGDLKRAKEYFERALIINEQIYGSDHPEIATGLNNIGTVLRDLGDLPGAKEHFEQALRIGERTYGPDHPNVAKNVGNLGRALQALGDLKGAKGNLERALRISERTYGYDHPEVAKNVNNLGLVLHDLGDLKGAKEHFERALRINERTYGYDHPEVAKNVNNLGRVLHDLGDLKGAKEHFERALRINERTYGYDHPEVAKNVNNLGRVLHDLGDLKGAKEHFERALKVDEENYGYDHPEVATDLINLGSILRDLGDLPGAKEHFGRALRINERTYGPDHPDVAKSVSSLGFVLYDLGDLPGAREHFERALRIDEKVYGTEHPEVGRAFNNLGGVLQALGDLLGAKAYFERA